MKLKYQDIAKPGDRIRAYDFARRTDCYIEGTVLDVNVERGYRAFAVLVDADCWGGRLYTRAILALLTDAPRTRIGSLTHVPLETTDDFEGRIINLTTTR